MLPMPQFSPANAREMAARSHAARKKRTIERDAAQNLAEPVSQTIADQPKPDEFIARRLARVRKQLRRIDDLLDTETDPAKLDKLASASSRLAEQERVLSDRPLPGSRRPPTPKDRQLVPEVPQEME